MAGAVLGWQFYIVTDAQQTTSKWGQLLRYGIVGVATNLAGYCLYLILTAFVLPPKTTMTILYTTGAILGFIGNRQFTFRHKGKLPRAAVAYTLAHLVGWGMNYLLLYVVADRWGYPHQLVQAMAVLVIAGYLFIALRYFVFPAQKTKDGATA